MPVGSFQTKVPCIDGASSQCLQKINPIRDRPYLPRPLIQPRKHSPIFPDQSPLFHSWRTRTASRPIARVPRSTPAMISAVKSRSISWRSWAFPAGSSPWTGTWKSWESTARQASCGCARRRPSTTPSERPVVSFASAPR